MIIHNNSTPWVILAILVMMGCAISGMLIGNAGPYNSPVAVAKIPIQQTQGSLDSHATQSAIEMAETQQAPLIEQTAMVAQMTTIPLQQTATQAAAYGNTQLSMVQATQTAIANNMFMENLSGNVTATAIAREQFLNSATSTTEFGLITIGVVLIAGWVLAHILIEITKVRAQEKAAQAKLLSEQRRLVIIRASIKAQERRQKEQVPQLTPISLMRKPGNGKELPRAQ
jgi:hypothetical protein